LEAVRPAAVLVQGDTTTTFAAALAAFHARIPVGHVEAGPRTWRKGAPLPGGLDRPKTTAPPAGHHAPPDWAPRNSAGAGVAPEKVTITGNPVIDALRWIASRRLGHEDPFLARLDGRRLVLVTAHRRESFGAPFAELCEALRDIVRRNDDVELVYPVHL